MSNERTQLALDAAQLSRGTTIRMVCPFCGGGSTGEASLNLTHSLSGALLFYCHRARCNAKGMLGGGPYLHSKERLEPRPDRSFDLSGCLTTFPAWVVDRCRDEWSIVPESAGWLWDDNTCRIIMPVIGPAGERRGHIARVPPKWKVNPKSLRYTVNDNAPWAHWEMSGCSTEVPLVIVEDIPSAFRLNRMGYAAVSLCGTRMDVDVQQEIADATKLWRFSTIHVALDKDAARLTFLHAKDLMMRGLPAEPLLIDKDFKNMTDEELDCTVSNDY